MRGYGFGALLVCAMILGMSAPSFAACDQTLSPGADVASAIVNGAAGSTICLNSGSYGTVNLLSVVKASDITVRSVSGNTATLGISINNATHIAFANLTITGLDLQGSATKYITVRNSTFTGQTVLRMDGNSNANILLDGNTFDNISVCGSCYEGRVQVAGGNYPVGVTITNNHFGGPGESDGIQTGAPGVIIGPGNVFDGIVQLNYSRHVDAIQGYGQSYTTINGNYFVNNDTEIMMPDGGYNEHITNNVFIAAPGNNGIQLGSHINDVFEHNTVKNITVNMDKKVESTTLSQNDVARNNIMINSWFKTVDSGGTPSCSNCTFDHNLFNTSSYASGTQNLIGNPTFVGGSSPTTWAGYQLTTTSLGYRAATDGNDMGSNYFGGAVPPVAPTNLAVQ